MNKVAFYNDTGRRIGLHPAFESFEVTCDMNDIQHGQVAIFTLPPNTYPLIKMWDYRRNGRDGDLQILIIPEKE